MLTGVLASNKNKRKSSNPVKNSFHFEANHHHNNGIVLNVSFFNINFDFNFYHIFLVLSVYLVGFLRLL